LPVLPGNPHPAGNHRGSRLPGRCRVESPFGSGCDAIRARAGQVAGRVNGPPVYLAEWTVGSVRFDPLIRLHQISLDLSAECAPTLTAVSSLPYLETQENCGCKNSFEALWQDPRSVLPHRCC